MPPGRPVQLGRPALPARPARRGSQGPAGPAGATGATGARGPAGKVEVITCTEVTTTVNGKKKTKQVCTSKLVSGTVTLKGKEIKAAKLVRGKVVFATGKAQRSGRTTHLVLTPKKTLTRGSYTLQLGVGKLGATLVVALR